MGTIVPWPHGRTSSKRDPKIVLSTSNPRRSNSSENTKNKRGGIAPLAFQLETAGGLTPAKEAVAPGPPSALMISPTDLSIPPFTSNDLNVSSLQMTSIDTSEKLKSDRRMDPNRDEIVFRLNLLPGVLKLGKGALAEALGGKPSDWSNWVKPNGPATIPRPRAWELDRLFGIGPKWTYDGDYSDIRNNDLKLEILKAEREARSRPPAPPKPAKKPRKRANAPQ